MGGGKRNATGGGARDMRVARVRVYFLPVATRVPLKFGTETLTEVTCVRVSVDVVRSDGAAVATGWGETPLSVQWVWPSAEPYLKRLGAMRALCLEVGEALAEWGECGHPMELGHAFQERVVPELARRGDAGREGEAMPYLGALVCLSAFDIALHDAYGRLHGADTYATYTGDYMGHDLAYYLEGDGAFAGKHPGDYLAAEPMVQLPVWHLVGGLDPVEAEEMAGAGPDDGYPVLLRDWIRTDGLRCLKIKLRGNDGPWDYARMVSVGKVGGEEGVRWLSADFNCTVTDPGYVNEILDRLRAEHPRIFDQILYVEQPFPYDLEKYGIDVRGVSERKPLFLDESAHDWKYVRLGRELGWSGVALKTCKTQTGALLSLCWAKENGMPVMVQDLTNPMLAAVPHVRLAAHAGTIMGVESNAMQFYPEASAVEAKVHPGIYRRRAGSLDLSTLGKVGFGYREDEIGRRLPEPDGDWGGR